MKYLLIILFLFFNFNLKAIEFDLECIPQSGNLNGESLKIIYTPNKKDILQNGKSLSYNYDAASQGTTKMLNLTVDDYFIKFSYTFTAPGSILIPGYTGEWYSTHYREINRATGIMTVRATLYENGETSDFPGGIYSLKCSKRKNEF